MAQQDNMAAAETVVGPSVKIQGDLVSEGNIRIEGAVAGKVATTQSVHVGDKAKIAADIQAGNAIIAGEVHGNLRIAESLILQPSARIAGDISCTTLRVEDGAQFSGKCSMKGAVIDKQTGTLKSASSSKASSIPEPEDEE
jgi:cytoskeletal protein CcmA (bactofilin family)